MIRRALLFSLVAIFFSTAASAQSCLPGASWCSGAYSYDAAGNIRAIGNDVYIYDTAGRLVSGTADKQRNPQSVSQQDYSYDAFGNRISASRANGSVDCPGGCELPVTIDSSTNHINNSGAQYDAAGNLFFLHNVVGTTTYDATYSYDTAGRLARAIANTDDRQFLYTADDERIATANGATWTWTVRGLDGKVLREFTSMPDSNTGLPTANRQWAKDYVWRDGLLLASITPTTPGVNTTRTQHFHLDHLGTPRLVTGDNGVTLGIHAYYPFGAELNLGLNEQPNELMKFTGHERDLLAGDSHTLDYMHARYEMGTMGRFLSIDPVISKGALQNPQIWNRYSYVANNPLKLVDPDGKLIRFFDGDYSREVAFAEFQKLFSKNARQFIAMDKNGYARLKGISRSDFAAKFGGTAAKLGAMIAQGGWTANVRLAESSVAADGGGAATRSFGDKTTVEINPFLLESYGSNSIYKGGVQQTIGSAMAHELLGHAYPYSFGIEIMSPHKYGWMNSGPKQEGYAIWAENEWRAEQGRPLRTFYTKQADYVPPDN